MNDPREALAEYAHTAWSGWMRYMFSKGLPDAVGGWTMPRWAVERWTRQMETPYAALPEEEKKSDRAEADTMLALLTHDALYSDNTRLRTALADAEARMLHSEAAEVELHRELEQARALIVATANDVNDARYERDQLELLLSAAESDAAALRQALWIPQDEHGTFYCRICENRYPDHYQDCPALLPNPGAALLAELEAARKVVEAARQPYATGRDREQELAEAIAAYDTPKR